MSDAKTIDAYNQNVEAYAKMVEYGKPDKALQTFMNKLSNGASVLDLGCGPGNSAAMMRDAGLKADATDASPEMVLLAKQQYDLDVRLATFDDLKEIDKYDGIWANFSLLHASREAFPTYIKAINQALKENGIFHIGMKTGSGEKRDHLNRFYTYYTVSELTTYLTENGFHILSKTEGEDPGLAGSVDPWVVLLASKVSS